MATYGFSKDAMLLELKSILMAESNIAGRFFNPSAARALFGLEPSSEPIQFADLDISDLHITRVFGLLYDFVMNAEWDMFGNLLHPFSMRVDATGFIERALAAVAFEMEFPAFAIGGQHGAVENGLCLHIARAAGGLIKIWEPEESGDTLTVEELAAVAHVDVRTVRNAASELEIRRNEVFVDRAETWLASRRMYRTAHRIDSIDAIDTRTFRSLSGLLAFIAQRCRERGIDESVFTARVGWRLDALMRDTAEAAPPPLFSWETPVDLGKLELASWQRIAALIDVNWIWLYARLLRTAEVFMKSHTITWYDRAVWQLWDSQLAAQSEPTILVPVAADGTWFHVGLERNKGFLIGGKKDKRYVAGFSTALEALKAMPHAYWHRPNPKSGLWGVVKALSWKEVSEVQVLGISEHVEH